MDTTTLRGLVARVRDRAVPDDQLYACLDCRDSHWQTIQVDGVRRVIRCACVQRVGVSLLDCPKEFTGLGMSSLVETPENAESLDTLRTWVADQDGTDLYLYGPVGRGKTRYACAAAHALGRPCRFVLAEGLCRQVLADGFEQETWATAVHVPVLVLDDIGVASSDFSRRTLTTLYTERRNRGLRTLITSNLDLRSLVESWNDERFGSRVVGQALILKVEGTDWRRRRL